MAAVTRQPFAPLNGARLQSLTSLKNRQNAVSNNGPTKRKASETLDADDFENVDPVLFAKRSKASGGGSFAAEDFVKPSALFLTKAPSTPVLPGNNGLSDNSAKALDWTSSQPTTSRPRSYLQPKSPAARLNTSLAKSVTPQSAPAGRSPTRGSKRIGLLSSRRRFSGPTGRAESSPYSFSAAVPFSLDAALKGTISNYASRPSSSVGLSAASGLDEPDLKASWFFDIHEDTPEQEMTNLLQHSTCVLDISSDEESEVKSRRERAEGRDKENVPPPDDVSQTTRASAAVGSSGSSVDDMLVEKSRDPLSEMNAADFYTAGCDGSEVVIVPGDEEEEVVQGVAGLAEIAASDFAPDLHPVADVRVEVDQLMNKTDVPAIEAALLEPIEGTGESFDLWESGSSKDEAEAPGSPAPVVDAAPL